MIVFMNVNEKKYVHGQAGILHCKVNIWIKTGKGIQCYFSLTPPGTSRCLSHSGQTDTRPLDQNTP